MTTLRHPFQQALDLAAAGVRVAAGRAGPARRTIGAARHADRPVRAGHDDDVRAHPLLVLAGRTARRLLHARQDASASTQSPRAVCHTCMSSSRRQRSRPYGFERIRGLGVSQRRPVACRFSGLPGCASGRGPRHHEPVVSASEWVICSAASAPADRTQETSRSSRVRRAPSLRSPGFPHTLSA